MESKMQPVSMAELLPALTGIMSKEAIQSLTAKKAPRSTPALSETYKKIIKPLTIAEVNAEFSAIKGNSSRKAVQPCMSARKKNWNSSVKVDKKINRIANGSVKHSAVRKVLTFPANPGPSTVSMPTVNPETPRFCKPKLKVKKPLYASMQPQIIKSTDRISGVCNITQTPRERTIMNRNKITQAYKENLPIGTNVNKKIIAPPKPVYHKKIITNTTPVTSLFNDSCTSNGDESFLQKEKEICNTEEKIERFSEEHTLENIAEVSPPVSTPFKEYRSVHEYFNNSSAIKNTADCDDTIMCFDKTSTNNKHTNALEGSVMSQLCELFNKACMSNTEKKTEIDDLSQEERQIEHSIKMIDNVIQNLITIKETQLNLLEQTRNKRNKKTESLNKTLVKNNDIDNVISEQKMSPENKLMPVKRPSVIKENLKLSYKIPKKTTCLIKKVFHKSMPNISSDTNTSELLNNDKALDMYMKLKEQMNFLNTPIAKRANDSRVPDTPAITSHNLQMQLDKLYNDS